VSLAEIPQEISPVSTLHFVETMDEVLQIALERPTVRSSMPPLHAVAEPFVAGARKTRV